MVRNTRRQRLLTVSATLTPLHAPARCGNRPVRRADLAFGEVGSPGCLSCRAAAPSRSLLAGPNPGRRRLASLAASMPLGLSLRCSTGCGSERIAPASSAAFARSSARSFSFCKTAVGNLAVSLSTSFAQLWHNQIPLVGLRRASAVSETSYRTPPGDAAEMWEATPMLTEAIPSSRGPTVARRHREQWYPARFARVSTIGWRKSSRIRLVRPSNG
jgi:hypothetical protein